MSDGDGYEEAVRVFVRIRPLNKREIAEKQTIGWNFNETSMLEDTPNGQRVYAFDRCFTPTSTNQEMYETIGKPIVLRAMEGYNGTILSYGQTGSGKTWTMRGTEGEPGMIVLCIRDILGWIRSHPEIQYKISVAYLEVYNEEINDLLGETGATSKNLKIVSEDAVRGAVIGGLVEEEASTYEQFMEILRRGEQSQSYAHISTNAESSRSHTICRIIFEARVKAGGQPSVNKDYDDSVSGGAGPGGYSSSPSAGRVSCLNFVDLAGSERQNSTKSEEKVSREDANINISLLALRAVIKKLSEVSKVKKGADKSSSFIPYRDSKLTRILKNSLGGNALTNILCTVIPTPMHREETVSTLKFGQLGKSIKNTVKANDGLKQYHQNIADLKAQVDSIMTGGFGAGHLKAVFESKLKNIEAFMTSKGISPYEITAVMNAAIISNEENSGGDGGKADKDLGRLINEKISVLQSRLTALQEENVELLQMKSSYEDDDQRLQEIHEEMSKVEEERKILQSERFKVIRDSKALDEKEARIGTLLTNLDDRESKLRLKLVNMQDQLSQWQRSIADLQKREDLVEEWKRSHEQKEKKLDEMRKHQERKYQELEEREKKITEEENKAKQEHKEMVEREQRLQVGISRVSNGEIANTQKEESLQAFEVQLKKKEQESDIRERELYSRRKEMESWDVLLREKDRKLLIEQHALDDREQSISSNEEKVKAREIEIERRTLEIKQKEAVVTELNSKYEKLLAEAEERVRDLKERDREYQSLRKELGNREEELRKWEKHLMKLQEQMKGIDQRERHLKTAEEHFRKQESEFYNIKIGQITSRYNQELKKLEDVVAKQLKIASDFQKELDSTRGELSARTKEMHVLDDAPHSRQLIIDRLREQLRKMEGGSINGLVATSQNTEFFDGTAPSSSSSTAAANAPMMVNELDTASKSHNFHHDLNNPSSITQQFMTQLAVARKMVYQVLEQLDTLPESQSPVVMRRNVPVRVSTAAPSPPPPGRGAVPMYSPQDQAQLHPTTAYGVAHPPPPPPPPPLPTATFTPTPSATNNNSTATANNHDVIVSSLDSGQGSGEDVPSQSLHTSGSPSTVMPRMGSLQQLFGSVGTGSLPGINNNGDILLAFQHQQSTLLPASQQVGPETPSQTNFYGSARARKNALTSSVLNPVSPPSLHSKTIGTAEEKKGHSAGAVPSSSHHLFGDSQSPPPPPPPPPPPSAGTNTVASLRSSIQTTGSQYHHEPKVFFSSPETMGHSMTHHSSGRVVSSSLTSPPSFHTSPTAAASSNITSTGTGSKRNAILSPIGHQHITVDQMMISGDEQTGTFGKVSVDLKSGLFKKVVREFEANHMASPPPPVAGRGRLFSPPSSSK